MQNLKIYFPLVNGSSQPLDYDNGREMIERMVTDDWGAPPISMVFEAKADDGRVVRISIPYGKSDEVHVSIEDGE